jgi:hypothetical protein
MITVDSIWWSAQQVRDRDLADLADLAARAERFTINVLSSHS